MPRTLGSTSSHPFTSLLSRYLLTTSAGAVSNNFFPINTLLNGDLITRQVRLLRVVAKFHPLGVGTGINMVAQLQYLDPLTSVSLTVPISTEKPLSLTNMTTLTGVLPLQVQWQTANSTGVVLNIPVWSNTANRPYVDIYCTWIVAQDNLV